MVPLFIERKLIEMMMKLYKKSAFLMMALFFTVQSYGQTTGLGTWNVLTGKLTFNKKLFTMAEGLILMSCIIV
jgi:hypothetical protein